MKKNIICYLVFGIVFQMSGQRFCDYGSYDFLLQKVIKESNIKNIKTYNFNSNLMIEEVLLDSLNNLKSFKNYKEFHIADESCMDKSEYVNVYKKSVLKERTVYNISEDFFYKEKFFYKSNNLVSIESKNDTLTFEYKHGKLSKVKSGEKTIYYLYNSSELIDKINICYKNDCDFKKISYSFYYTKKGFLKKVINNYNLKYEYHYNNSFLRKLNVFKGNKIINTYVYNKIGTYSFIYDFNGEGALQKFSTIW